MQNDHKDVMRNVCCMKINADDMSPSQPGIEPDRQTDGVVQVASLLSYVVGDTQVRRDDEANC